MAELKMRLLECQGTSCGHVMLETETGAHEYRINADAVTVSVRCCSECGCLALRHLDSLGLPRKTERYKKPPEFHTSEVKLVDTIPHRRYKGIKAAMSRFHEELHGAEHHLTQVLDHVKEVLSMDHITPEGERYRLRETGHFQMLRKTYTAAEDYLADGQPEETESKDETKNS